MRLLQSPNADMKALSIVAPIDKGGTGADNSTEAVQNLGGLNAISLGQANGIAKLNNQGKLDLDVFPTMVTVGPTLNGPTVIYTGQTVQYTITNYDINTTYSISASVGTLTRSGDTLTYTAPSTAGPLVLTVNNKVASAVISTTSPVAPNIASPVTGSTGIMSSVNASSSSFAMNNDSDTHASSDWQIATDNQFTNIVTSTVNDTINKTSWTATGLSENTTYYMRVRYKGTIYGYGAWSNLISFTTRTTFLPVYEQAILSPSDRAASDQFGYSVDISSDGTRVVVGAAAATIGSFTSCGKAYIFTRSGNSWTQEAVLSASDKVNSAVFGVSVAMDSTGTRVVIGASSAVKNSINSGAIYVYVRSGTTWTEEVSLVSSNITAGDQFGRQVSINSDGSRILASSWMADPGNLTSAGAAYIYLRSGTTWTEEAILTASDKAAGDNFGSKVQISKDGTRAVIAAYFGDPSGLNNAGKAYVYVRSGTTWTEEAILTASDKAAGDNFGQSVSINSNGTRIAVGAHLADPSGLNNAGKAYIFSRSGTTWTEESILTTATKAENDQFGFSLSIASDASFVACASFLSEVSGYTDNGSVTVFKRSGVTWTEGNTVTASDKGNQDRYGQTISISENNQYMVVGANFADAGGLSNSGKVYIYA